MKYNIGDKVVWIHDKTKYYIVENVKEDYEITGPRPVYQLSCYNDCWFDECDLELYNEEEFNRRIAEYSLTFADVISEIFETKGWYQGINFNERYFIAIGGEGKIVEKYFVNKNGKAIINKVLEIDSRIAKMRYRRIK